MAHKLAVRGTPVLEDNNKSKTCNIVGVCSSVAVHRAQYLPTWWTPHQWSIFVVLALLLALHTSCSILPTIALSHLQAALPVKTQRVLFPESGCIKLWRQRWHNSKIGCQPDRIAPCPRWHHSKISCQPEEITPSCPTILKWMLENLLETALHQMLGWCLAWSPPCWEETPCLSLASH